MGGVVHAHTHAHKIHSILISYIQLSLSLHTPPPSTIHSPPLQHRLTYQWTVPSSAIRGGPADLWGLFTYASTVDVVGHSYAGLQGLVRVSARPGFTGDVTAQDSRCVCVLCFVCCVYAFACMYVDHHTH